MRNWILLGAAALAVAAADTPAVAHGFMDEDGDGINDAASVRHRLGGPILPAGAFSTRLTDAQEAELQAKIDELTAAGATKDELAAAIRAALTGYGIDLPDYADHVVAHLGTKLTDAQEAELQALADGLEAQGAEADAIKAAVDAKLTEYGVETTGLVGRPHPGHFGPVMMFSGKLTDAQEAELQALLDELEAGDATRADVRAAIDAKLLEYGIERPERGDLFVDRIGNLLTDAQEVELQALIDGLQADGATRADVKAAVDAKLDEYGVEVPVPAGVGPHRAGGPGGRGMRGPARGHGRR
jgi:ribonuclease HI